MILKILNIFFKEIFNYGKINNWKTITKQLQNNQLYNLDDYIGSVDSNIPKTISLNKKKKI